MFGKSSGDTPDFFKLSREGEMARAVNIGQKNIWKKLRLIKLI